MSRTSPSAHGGRAGAARVRDPQTDEQHVHTLEREERERAVTGLRGERLIARALQRDLQCLADCWLVVDDEHSHPFSMHLPSFFFHRPTLLGPGCVASTL